MKTKVLLGCLMFFFFAMNMSAQVQLLYMEGGRNVIDRNKKLYWMDGDDDPCFDILNYKKVGNKETFTLKEKEDPTNTYAVEMMLDAKTKKPVQITLTHKLYGKTTSKVETSSGSEEEDQRLYKYFNELAGNNVTASKTTPVSEKKAEPKQVKKEEIEEEDVEETPATEPAKTDAGSKVKGAAKKTFGKVKGLIKKK